jgi:hypothetical protein
MSDKMAIVLDIDKLLAIVKDSSPPGIRPGEQVKRIGVEEYQVEDFHADLLNECTSIASHLKLGNFSSKEAGNLLAYFLLDYGSNLYSFGYSETTWKYWTALSSFAHFLGESFLNSFYYAAISNEWEFLKNLPAVPPNPAEEEGVILYCSMQNIGLPDNFKDNIWFEAVNNIENKNFVSFEKILKEISNYWMGETEWETFARGHAPHYEPVICALTAIARYNGYEPYKLDTRELNFLEPGLTISQDAQWYRQIIKD